MPKIPRARVRSIDGEIVFVYDDTVVGNLSLNPAGLLPGVLADYITIPSNSNSVVSVYWDLFPWDGEGFDSWTFYTKLTPLPVTAIGSTVLGAPTAVSSQATSDAGPVTSPAAVLPLPGVAALVSSTTTQSLVGHPIMIYSVPQIVQLTYPAATAFGGIFMENYPLNRTDFRLVRGIQNEINFYVRDVDRKPIGLGSSETLTINILDPDTDTLLMTRNLATIDSSQGIYLLTILPAEMDAWPSAPVRWSMSYNRANGTTVLLWTDRVYSPYSTCTITEGPIPGPASTVTFLWSGFTLMGDGNYYSQALVGSAAQGFSGGMQTFLITMTAFVGSVRIDASLVAAPVNTDLSTDWFQVDLQTFPVANTGNIVLNELGSYLWMRVVVIPGTGGIINQVEYKS